MYRDIQWNLSIKDTPSKGTSLMKSLSAARSTQTLPLKWETSLYRTASWVLMVSTIERFHCMFIFVGVYVVVCGSGHGVTCPTYSPLPTVSCSALDEGGG